MTSSPKPTIADLARACAAAATPGARLDDPLSPFAQTFQALLAGIMDANPRLIFDRAGRPAAVGAVRDALPQLEQELFDAILEDCACELAATHEALGQVVQVLKG
jgi:hypothetical protein